MIMILTYPESSALPAFLNQRACASFGRALSRRVGLIVSATSHGSPSLPSPRQMSELKSIGENALLNNGEQLV